MKHLVLSCAAGSLLAAGGVAHGENAGFTAEAALGAGLIVTEDGGGVGPAGLSLGLGAYLTPETALMLRFVPTTVFIETASGARIRATRAFLGLGVQHLVADRFFVGGGAGAMVSDESHSFGGRDWSGGADLRAGFVLLEAQRVVLHTSIEATGGVWVAGSLSTSVETTLSWQIGAQLR